LKTLSLSVVIPAFNTGEQLINLVDSLTEFFRNKITFDIIIIDDSGDNNRLSFNHPELKYFKLKKNYGQHLATYYGILQAKGQHILTLDDDVILPEEKLEVIFSRIPEPNDLQYFVNDDYTEIDKIKFSIIKTFFRFALFRTPPKYGTSQRLITQELAQKIIAQNYRYIYFDALLMLQSTSKTHCVNYIAKNNSPELKNRYSLSNRLFLLTNSYLFYTPLVAQIAYLWLIIGMCLLVYYAVPIIGLAFILTFIITAVFAVWGYTTVVVANDIETA
jgi:glycosyltransferase involved in cell wall biosynthesis